MANENPSFTSILTIISILTLIAAYIMIKSYNIHPNYIKLEIIF